MLRFLFPRLTPVHEQGTALLDAVTAAARQPHWYREGAVPDEIDGRFRVLATIAALVMVRLEELDATPLSVALTERFIDVMESEHRELGLGDPTLGKTVRRLVGSLGRRVDIWRSAVAGERDWSAAAGESLYDAEPTPAALDHAEQTLRELWMGMGTVDAEALEAGRIA
jgi:cytochrome b pre-mRNA-processing protein 3